MGTGSSADTEGGTGMPTEDSESRLLDNHDNIDSNQENEDKTKESSGKDPMGAEVDRKDEAVDATKHKTTTSPANTGGLESTNNDISDSLLCPEKGRNDETNVENRLSGKSWMGARDDKQCDETKNHKQTSNNIDEGSGMNGSPGIMARTQERIDDSQPKPEMKDDEPVIEESRPNVPKANTANLSSASTVSESIGEDGKVAKPIKDRTPADEIEEKDEIPVNINIVGPVANSKTTAGPTVENNRKNANILAAYERENLETLPSSESRRLEDNNTILPPNIDFKSRHQKDKTPELTNDAVTPNPDPLPSPNTDSPADLKAPISVETLRATDMQPQTSTATKSSGESEADSTVSKQIVYGSTNGNHERKIGDDVHDSDRLHEATPTTSEMTIKQSLGPTASRSDKNPGPLKSATLDTQKGAPTKSGNTEKNPNGEKNPTKITEGTSALTTSDQDNDNLKDWKSSITPINGLEEDSLFVAYKRSVEGEASDHAEDPPHSIVSAKLVEDKKECPPESVLNRPDSDSMNEIPEGQTMNDGKNLSGQGREPMALDKDGDGKQRGQFRATMIAADTGESSTRTKTTESPGGNGSEIAKSPPENDESNAADTIRESAALHLEEGENPWKSAQNDEAPGASSNNSDAVAGSPGISSLSYACGENQADDSKETVENSKLPGQNGSEESKVSARSARVGLSDASKEKAEHGQISQEVVEKEKNQLQNAIENNGGVIQNPVESEMTTKLSAPSQASLPRNGENSLRKENDSRSKGIPDNSVMMANGPEQADNAEISSAALKKLATSHEQNSLTLPSSQKIVPERIKNIPNGAGGPSAKRNKEPQILPGLTHEIGTRPLNSSEPAQKDGAKAEPKNLTDVAFLTDPKTRHLHKLMLMRLFTGSKDQVLNTACTQEDMKSSEISGSSGKRTLLQMSLAPSKDVIGLLPSSLLEFRRQSKLDEDIGGSRRDKYRSMLLSGVNTWAKAKAAKKKRVKTLPFCFEYSECSISAISSWATQPDSQMAQLNSSRPESRSTLGDRITTTSFFRKCGHCGKFGHYELECRERRMPPNQTAAIANEMKTNALLREMKTEHHRENPFESTVAESTANGHSSCKICKSGLNNNQIIACDGCNSLYHLYCVNPPLSEIPGSEWLCHQCKQPDFDATGSVVNIEACDGFLVEQRKTSRFSNDKRNPKLAPFRDWQISISAVSTFHASDVARSSEIEQKRKRPSDEIDGISIIATSTSRSGETSTKNMLAAAASRVDEPREEKGSQEDDLVPGTVVAWFAEATSADDNSSPFLGAVLNVNANTKQVLVRSIQQVCNRVLGENGALSTEDFDYQFIQNMPAGATFWRNADDLHVVAAAAGQGSVIQFQEVLPSRLVTKRKQRSTGAAGMKTMKKAKKY